MKPIQTVIQANTSDWIFDRNKDELNLLKTENIYFFRLMKMNPVTATDTLTQSYYIQEFRWVNSMTQKSRREHPALLLDHDLQTAVDKLIRCLPQCKNTPPEAEVLHLNCYSRKSTWALLAQCQSSIELKCSMQLKASVNVILLPLLTIYLYELRNQLCKVTRTAVE